MLKVSESSAVLGEVKQVEETQERMEDLTSPIQEGEGAYSPLQVHFLQRLNRLLRLRREQAGQLNSEGLRLLDRAIYSTYCSLVDLGLATEAQKVLHRFAVPAARPQGEE